MYDSQSSTLKRDGQEVGLRGGRSTRLLSCLLCARGETVPTDKILDEVWKDCVDVTYHNVEELVCRLRRVLGSEIVVGSAKQGFRIGVPVQCRPRAVEPSPQYELRVFPGAAIISGPGYTPSWLGSGKNDEVGFIKVVAPGEDKPRQLIPLASDYPSTLAIPFRHRIRNGPERESWWSAAVALAVDQETGTWLPVDLLHFQFLSFEARFSTVSRHKRVLPASPRLSPVPFKVRLEDNSIGGLEGSFRNSTSWFPGDVRLTDDFLNYSLSLQKFSWASNAFRWNFGAVNRAQVFQIVFGQDSGIAACSGTVEIRNVRFR